VEPVVQNYISSVNSLVHKFACACSGLHKQDCWGIPDSLMTILIKYFHLNVDGCSSPLHVDKNLVHYYTDDGSDSVFGANFDILSADLRGSSVFINPLMSGQVTDGKHIGPRLPGSNTGWIVIVLRVFLWLFHHKKVLIF